MGFFKRLRVICGGQIVEDIDNYSRLHEMFHNMRPTEKRLNDAIEGFDTVDTGNINIDIADSPTPIKKKVVKGRCALLLFPDYFPKTNFYQSDIVPFNLSLNW